MVSGWIRPQLFFFSLWCHKLPKLVYLRANQHYNERNNNIKCYAFSFPPARSQTDARNTDGYLESLCNLGATIWFIYPHSVINPAEKKMSAAISASRTSALCLNALITRIHYGREGTAMSAIFTFPIFPSVWRAGEEMALFVAAPSSAPSLYFHNIITW